MFWLFLGVVIVVGAVIGYVTSPKQQRQRLRRCRPERLKWAEWDRIGWLR